MNKLAHIARYTEAFSESQSFLCQIAHEMELHIPIDIKKIIQKCNIILVTVREYKKFRIETNSSHKEVQIKDGRTYYDPNKDIYLIVYNDTLSDYRIRFTLAHELAHIILCHLNSETTELCRGGIGNIEYYRLEGEANTFAGNFLLPPILYQQCITTQSPLSTNIISRFFQISESAINGYRLDDYAYWCKHLHPSKSELIIKQIFQADIERRSCENCGFSTTSRQFIYCPICGKNKFKYLEEVHQLREYKPLPLNQYKRLVECVRCGNGQHLPNGNYCMICGELIVNMCTDYKCIHNEPLPGHARFCPYCGAATTFLSHEILYVWNFNQDDNIPF